MLKFKFSNCKGYKGYSIKYSILACYNDPLKFYKNIKEWFIMFTNMTAEHARWPKENDVIFGIAGRAAESIKSFQDDRRISILLF